jgi:hypothetical protein
MERLETLHRLVGDCWQEIAKRSSTVNFQKSMRFSHYITWREVLLLVVTLAALRITFNIFFHRLAKFPGPFWARASLVGPCLNSHYYKSMRILTA